MQVQNERAFDDVMSQTQWVLECFDEEFGRFRGELQSKFDECEEEVRRSEKLLSDAEFRVNAAQVALTSASAWLAYVTAQTLGFGIAAASAAVAAARRALEQAKKNKEAMERRVEVARRALERSRALNVEMMEIFGREIRRLQSCNQILQMRAGAAKRDMQAYLATLGGSGGGGVFEHGFRANRGGYGAGGSVKSGGFMEGDSGLDGGGFGSVGGFNGGEKFGGGSVGGSGRAGDGSAGLGSNLRDGGFGADVGVFDDDSTSGKFGGGSADFGFGDVGTSEKKFDIGGSAGFGDAGAGEKKFDIGGGHVGSGRVGGGSNLGSGGGSGDSQISQKNGENSCENLGDLGLKLAESGETGGLAGGVRRGGGVNFAGDASTKPVSENGVSFDSSSVGGVALRGGFVWSCEAVRCFSLCEKETTKCQKRNLCLLIYKNLQRK